MKNGEKMDLFGLVFRAQKKVESSSCKAAPSKIPGYGLQVNPETGKIQENAAAGTGINKILGSVRSHLSLELVYGNTGMEWKCRNGMEI